MKNKNAAKPGKRGYAYIRCLIRDRERWEALAERKGMRFSVWAARHLNAQAARATKK